MKPSVARLFSAAAVSAAILIPVQTQTAVAAEGKPEHVRGTVTGADANGLVLRTREGETVRMTLPEKVRISGLAAIDLAKVSKGAYIGTAAVPADDGTLHAKEVLVFPEQMRGVGEGHRPWDLTAESTMTNAAVEAVVDGVKGRVMTLAYKGGMQKITIPPGTPIVTIVKADRTMLKPGAHVFAVAKKGAGGVYEPVRISIGMDGLVPPM